MEGETSVAGRWLGIGLAAGRAAAADEVALIDFAAAVGLAPALTEDQLPLASRL